MTDSKLKRLAVAGALFCASFCLWRLLWRSGYISGYVAGHLDAEVMCAGHTASELIARVKTGSAQNDGESD